MLDFWDALNVVLRTITLLLFTWLFYRIAKDSRDDK